MAAGLPYTIFPLGDTAVCLDFGNRISRDINDRVMMLYQYLNSHPLKGVTDLVPAYSSLTLHFDPVAYLHEISNGLQVYKLLKVQLDKLASSNFTPAATGKTVRVPVCYEKDFAPDLPGIAAVSGIPEQEIIALHTATLYHVYMLGFLPGFAYMGMVDAAIAMPRKQRPEPIAAGSVGIAGQQTGIYPLASPGGWQIIGRTPVTLFNKATGDTLFQPGDQVQFYSISSYEFENY